MKRIIILVCATLATLSAMAFSSTVKSKLVGDVKISCKESAWKIDTKIVSKGDIEEITIEMTATEPTTPTPLKVEFMTPQLDAHHLWHTNRSNRTILPPDWSGKY